MNLVPPKTRGIITQWSLQDHKTINLLRTATKLEAKDSHRERPVFCHKNATNLLQKPWLKVSFTSTPFFSNFCMSFFSTSVKLFALLVYFVYTWII